MPYFNCKKLFSYRKIVFRVGLGEWASSMSGLLVFAYFCT